jgi:hypothetical protein
MEHELYTGGTASRSFMNYGTAPVGAKKFLASDMGGK